VKDFPYNENEWDDIKNIADLTMDTIALIDKDNLLNE